MVEGEVRCTQGIDMSAMPKERGTQQLIGKKGELFVLGELLQRGFAPYVPLVDVDGVDALVPIASGVVLKLQVKTVATTNRPRWFQIRSVPQDKYFFILGLEMQDTKPGDVWILPASVFDRYANRPPKGTPRDLDLDTTRRGDIQPLKDILSGFRNRWELLADFGKYEDLLDYPEDLADLLAAKEALEAPEEEAVSIEQYEQGRFGVRG